MEDIVVCFSQDVRFLSNVMPLLTCEQGEYCSYNRTNHCCHSTYYVENNYGNKDNNTQCPSSIDSFMENHRFLQPLLLQQDNESTHLSLYLCTRSGFCGYQGLISKTISSY